MYPAWPTMNGWFLPGGAKFTWNPAGDMASPITHRRLHLVTYEYEPPLPGKVPLPEAGSHAIKVAALVVEVREIGGLEGNVTVLVVTWTGSLLREMGRISPSYCQL